MAEKNNINKTGKLTKDAIFTTTVKHRIRTNSMLMFIDIFCNIYILDLMHKTITFRSSTLNWELY